MTWLPTFNEKVLALSESNSIRMASILAITLGLGRILGGQLSERFHWTLSSRERLSALCSWSPLSFRKR